jgi:alanine racemase
MIRSAHALIRLESLTHNLNLIRSYAPNAKVMAVVKADAYGHGLIKTAQALNQSDAFAVACINEALTLRSAGILHPIICLQGFANQQELRDFSNSNIQAVVHSEHQIALLRSEKLKQGLCIWLKIDTGMSRLGFSQEEAQTVYQQLVNCSNVSKIRLMTHLANADILDEASTYRQQANFDQAIAGIEGCERSIANSAASFAYPKTQRDWIRPGLALYGISPFQNEQSHPDVSELKPVMSVRAPVIAIKQVKQGDRIGYGGSYTCPQDMRIGIVAMGYADGYPRSLEKTVPVSVRGRLCDVLGRVSMDMITIDLSDCDCEIGEHIELWGDDVPVADIAEAANTITYELLCRIAAHVRREYV